MPCRIYTDGRTRPGLVEPAFAGYSLGKWIDETGTVATLEVETTHFKGPAISRSMGFRSLRTTRPSSKSAFSSNRPGLVT
jgi:hypothetical protein